MFYNDYNECDTVKSQRIFNTISTKIGIILSRKELLKTLFILFET